MRITNTSQIFGQMEDKSTWNVTIIVTKALLEHFAQEGNKSVLEATMKHIQEGAEEQRKDARQEKLTKFKHNLIGRAQGGGRELHQVTKATPWRGEAKNPGHGGSRRDVRAKK